MNFMTDFLQNADPPTFLGQLALRAQTAHQVGCDFAKNPMKFNRFRILSLFYLFYIHEGYRYYLDMFTEEIKGIKVYDTHHLLKFSIKMFYLHRSYTHVRILLLGWTQTLDLSI